ncbi:hypothetical protein MA20_45680 [Bradyrhizobium japonicum]|uniref:Uncharacterized protein n=1 Tax=Bradyrhizobium japonicum TaxID=375 RepID=A0A0A3XIY1_BRAJP|nr:hypothetical protein [Bradyrhizobium japonicum]KGT73229.1 hypothetical protein MA20_45680 [Bradyrhizobium japonicum]
MNLQHYPVAPKPLRTDLPATVAAWHSNFSRERYNASVRRVIDPLILVGDFFMVNIGQCFNAQVSNSFDPIAFCGQLYKGHDRVFR